MELSTSRFWIFKNYAIVSQSTNTGLYAKHGIVLSSDVNSTVIYI